VQLTADGEEGFQLGRVEQGGSCYHETR
jgi:hypothetical protein